MTDPFNRLYSKIISEMSGDSFDFDAYGITVTPDGKKEWATDDDGNLIASDLHQIEATRKPKPRHAVKMWDMNEDETGHIETRESADGNVAEYKKDDWIMEDEQGGKYPIPGKHDGRGSTFEEQYDVEKVINAKYNDRHELIEGDFVAFSKPRRFFRTAKKLEITTAYGVYTATPGYYVRLVSEDGKTAKYDCPVALDAMQSGYTFDREVPSGNCYKVVDKSNVQE